MSHTICKKKSNRQGRKVSGVTLLCLALTLPGCVGGWNMQPVQENEADTAVTTEEDTGMPVFVETPLGTPVTSPPVAPDTVPPQISAAAPVGGSSVPRVLFVPVLVPAPTAYPSVSVEGTAAAGQPEAGSPPQMPVAQRQPDPPAAPQPPPVLTPSTESSAVPAPAVAQGPVTTLSVPASSRNSPSEKPAVSTAVQAPAPAPAPLVPAWPQAGQAPEAAQSSVSRPPASRPATGQASPGTSPAVATAPAVSSQKRAASTAPRQTAQKKKATGEQSAYNTALRAYEARRFTDSQQMFEAFVRDYPRSKLVPNAIYWQGECLYSQKRYPEAIFVFKDVITRYPKHTKTPDALLKTGMAYERMKDSDNARLHYQVLREDYPSSPAVQRGRNMKLF